MKDIYITQKEAKTFLTIRQLPDIPKIYIPSKKELETPWYRRFKNKQKKKR